MAKIKDIDELDNSEKENKFIAAADMSKGKKNKGGRPKKEPGQKASEQIFINVTPDEKVKIEAKAQELGISVSALCKISLAEYLK
ncbi:plasmid mobilization protein [Sulfurimonas sp.]|uniref:plasmid mobilization protein n=1 Tax=Sulfurimonas sp. TaxID=2022749 RepID=UPI003D101B7E